MSEISNLLTNIIEKFSIYTKEGLENLTSSMIVIFSSLFIHIYIVDINTLANYLDLLFYPIILIILYFIKINLFSHDYLLFGDENNNYVRASKHKLPSKYLLEKYDISNEDANHYWYNIFNSWQKKDHPRYGQVIRTFRRGYACRFIFYSIKLFEFLFILSLSIFIILNVYSSYINKMIYLYPNSYDMFGFIFLMAILKIFIIKLNNSNIKNLTGVWKKFEEINNDHINWLENNIKNKNELIQHDVK